MTSPLRHKTGSWVLVARVLFVVGLLAQVAFLVAVLRPSAGERAGTKSQSGKSKEGGARRPSNDLILRHVFHHGAGQPGPRARRLDITSAHLAAAAGSPSSHALGPFRFRSASVTIEKPAARYFAHHAAQIPMSPLMVAEDFPGPDVEDKETVVNLADMSENAYKPGRDDPEWLDVDESFNSSIPFGWDEHGIRGHVFSDETNTTLVLSVKGTTVSMFEGNGTSFQDKDNDNLYGSCCCGQGGPYTWRTVCDCKTGTYSCDDKCVREELRKPNRYYAASLELYEEVMQLYPNANVVTTGHSLGGVLASLIGLRQGIPAVTFEAYPQALAAKRLGLPTAGDVAPLRKHTGGFHFGHTADPIYMGTCNGGSSFCSLAGYAFETICHTGRKCSYDTVKDKGWSQSTNTHRLRYALEYVYKAYDKPATCVEEDVECVDCYLWKYGNGTKKRTSTTAVPTSTSTRTRTETCKTPGWWGCNDETATATATATSSSALGSVSLSSSSSSLSFSPSASTSTSTCQTPGWFGCKDIVSPTTSSLPITSSPPTTSSPPSSTPATSTKSTCSSKGWFGKCYDVPTTSSTPAAAGFAAWRGAAPARQTAY